jgi:hypothetical protein
LGHGGAGERILEWIQLAVDKVNFWALANTVMYFRVSYNAGNLFSR